MFKTILASAIALGACDVSTYEPNISKDQLTHMYNVGYKCDGTLEECTLKCIQYSNTYVALQNYYKAKKQCHDGKLDRLLDDNSLTDSEPTNLGKMCVSSGLDTCDLVCKRAFENSSKDRIGCMTAVLDERYKLQ